MKPLPSIQRAPTKLAAVVILLSPTIAVAQVESLNPNPTMPSGIGSPSNLEEYHHGSARGVPMGRLGGADQNPADIMLRQIGGKNSRRRTGHALIRGAPVRDAQRAEAYRTPLHENDAVYFSRRGDYENAIYGPSHGSYRLPLLRRAPASRQQSRR